MRIIPAFLFLLFACGFAFAQNEITSIVEKNFEYKDWVYKNIETGKDVNLRKFTNSKKLVMVVYWAPWCHNWDHDVDYVQGLYEKYKGIGFDVIGVAEYDPLNKMKDHIKEHKLTFTNVYESVSSADREKTDHYKQRREAGDIRKWGSPWYVFLDASTLEPEGQIVMSKKPQVVNGELKRDEVEKYIRQKLGLEESATGSVSIKSKEIEVCEPDTKTIEFKKPC
ncbi:MAG: TlpA family protein disulfide reductase [Pyrinomonadaceae bacterium]